MLIGAFSIRSVWEVFATCCCGCGIYLKKDVHIRAEFQKLPRLLDVYVQITGDTDGVNGASGMQTMRPRCHDDHWWLAPTCRDNSTELGLDLELHWLGNVEGLSTFATTIQIFLQLAGAATVALAKMPFSIYYVTLRGRPVSLKAFTLGLL